MNYSVVLRTIVIAALFGIGAGIVSCKNSRPYACQSSFVPHATADGAPVDKSLITLQPCGPPCWQNLYPGVSTAQDALRELQELEFVDPASIQQTGSSDPEALGNVYWNSAFSQSPLANQILMGKDGTIRYIRIELEYPLRLEELIQAQGPPTGYSDNPITFDRSTGCNKVDILWLESGLMVTLVYDGGDEFSLRNANVLTAVYFAPVSTITEFTTEIGFDYVERNFREWTSLEEILDPNQ